MRGKAIHYNTYQTAVYIRLSREDGDKEESDSVGNQRKLLTGYIRQKEDLILYDTYVDDGYSGTNFIRPDFGRMMRDIEQKKVNCVVVKDLSRFGRDYIDTGRYLERIFPELGVRFISVTDGIDSQKQAYDMLLPIKNIFNEQYARDISKKVHAAMRTKQQAGEFIGAFTSYGYRKSPADKNRLVIDEYAAEVVRRIFSMYIKGYGKQKIARLLNQEGVLSPAEYKQVSGLNYRNCNRQDGTSGWSYSTVNSILHREIYTGNMVQGTKCQHMRSRQKAVGKENWIVVENTHEPVIGMDIWKKAQKLLNKGTRVLDADNNPNVFAGLITCGDCRRAMTRSMWKKADGSRNYTYYCSTYKRYGRDVCTPHAFSAEVLERIVLEDVNKVIGSIPGLQMAVRKICEQENRKKAFAVEEEKRIRVESDQIYRQQKMLYEDYKSGLLSREEFLSYRMEYQKKRELCDRKLETIESLKDQALDGLERQQWYLDLVERGETSGLDRELAAEIIEGISVCENHRIYIRYNFAEADKNCTYIVDI